MSDITQLRHALIARVLEGEGRASHAQRRAAFHDAGLTEPLGALIHKVSQQAHKVTDEDIARVKASGQTEDQIFELVVCAALGQATRLHSAALAALEAAAQGRQHAPADPR